MAALANLQQTDNETLCDFMARFRHLTAQIWNLNPEVTLYSILLALHLGKFADSLCRRPLDSMDELCKWAKGYIRMVEMSVFRNEVRQLAPPYNKADDESYA